MTNKEILEGNKLIAEFMLTGCKLFGAFEAKGDSFDKKFISWFGEHIAEYHKSWNWIMPVVEKIQLSHFVTIQRNSTLIYEDDEDSKVINEPFGYGQQESYIQIVWKAVVDFIKWYNKQNIKN